MVSVSLHLSGTCREQSIAGFAVKGSGVPLKVQPSPSSRVSLSSQLPLWHTHSDTLPRHKVIY